MAMASVRAERGRAAGKGLSVLLAFAVSATTACEKAPTAGPATPCPSTPSTALASASAAPSSASTATAYSGHGVDSIPAEVLAKYAAKPLPPNVSRRIQSMLDVRVPGSGALSPDGKHLFFGWTVTGTSQIWRLDKAMGFPVQLTGGEDSASVAAISPDGKWLVVSRDRNGEENPGLYWMSADGGALETIQHIPKVQTTFAWLSPDGKYFYFQSNDVKPDSYAVYRWDVAAKKRELVYGEPGLWSVTDVRPKGTMGSADKLLMTKSVGSNQEEIFELDLATKKLEPLFGQGEKEEYDVAYGAADDEVIALTPKIGDFRRLYSWTTKDKKLTPIVPELAHDISGFSIGRSKKRILYTVNEDGYTRLNGIDARTKKPIAMPSVAKADHVVFGRTTDDGRFTTIKVDAGVSMPSSYVYDWQSSSLTEWFKPAAPELDASKFARASLDAYPARDGTKIPVFIRTPAACEKRAPADGPCPVIVSFHGGPESQTLPGFNTRAQMFVDAGFVYVEPNVRGSDGYGKTWIHADDGAKRLKILTDIEDASKFARERWTVGGKKPKVGIYGGSYGGYSVLAGMTIFAGAYDAGVSVVGISSLMTFLMNTAPYRRILRMSEYGDPEKDKAALEDLSPINHVDKVSAPMMLIQGATDPRVPVGEALQFYEALQKKGVPSELIVFPDEGHGMSKRPNQVLAYGHTIRFFEQYLKQ